MRVWWENFWGQQMLPKYLNCYLKYSGSGAKNANRSTNLVHSAPTVIRVVQTLRTGKYGVRGQMGVYFNKCWPLVNTCSIFEISDFENFKVENRDFLEIVSD